MFRLRKSSSRLRRFAVAGAVGVLGATVSIATVPATSSAQPTGLDHFLCYKASTVPPGFAPPTGVTLINQFSTNGFQPAIGALAKHCNPVEKIVPTGTFPITNPTAHLACLKITAPPQPTHVVSVTNQFGRARLTTGQPNLLCLPSWKSLTGPPNQPAPQPPGLDHFTCYPVTVVPGTPPFTPPSSVALLDQFARTPTPVTVLTPKLLCVPTEKILPTGAITPITNPSAHLMCFKVTQTPFPPMVFDQNQFGTAQVNLLKTNLLCLPSSKRVIS